MSSLLIVARLRAHGLLPAARAIAASYRLAGFGGWTGGARRELAAKMAARGWCVANIDLVLGREDHKQLPIYPLAEVYEPEQLFRCVPLAAVVSAGSCVRRQELAAPVGVSQWKRAVVSARYERCRECAMGRTVHEQVGPELERRKRDEEEARAAGLLPAKRRRKRRRAGSAGGRDEGQRPLEPRATKSAGAVVVKMESSDP